MPTHNSEAWFKAREGRLGESNATFESCFVEVCIATEDCPAKVHPASEDGILKDCLIFESCFLEVRATGEGRFSEVRATSEGRLVEARVACKGHSTKFHGVERDRFLGDVCFVGEVCVTEEIRSAEVCVAGKGCSIEVCIMDEFYVIEGDISAEGGFDIPLVGEIGCFVKNCFVKGYLLGEF